MIQKGVRVDSVVTLAGLIKIILHLRNPKIIEIKMACVCLVPVTLVEIKIRQTWQNKIRQIRKQNSKNLANSVLDKCCRYHFSK